MYALDRLVDIWHLEVFLYGDTPEDEEPMYEHPGDTMGMGGMRHTRRSVLGGAGVRPIDDSQPDASADAAFCWRYDVEEQRVIRWPVGGEEQP